MPREEIRERIREVAAQAGIEHLLGRETAALSGGERQLLAMAGILMMRPRVLVVDEPLANLDPATAERLLTLLRALADEGSAIVIVEHRVEEALDARARTACCTSKRGRPATSAPSTASSTSPIPASVKLPFDVVARRVAAWQPRDRRARRSATADRAHRRRPRPRRGSSSGASARRSAGHEILHGVDAALGPDERGRHARPQRLGQDDAVPDGDAAARHHGRRDPRRRRRDRRPRDRRARRREFGYVFQSPSQMLFARTVEEELLFGPRNLGRDPASFEELVAGRASRRTALADLEDIRERPPLALSFGQQKRLALAIALALRPPTLILDEPSAGQDHRTAEAFMREVARDPGAAQPVLRHARRGPCIDARRPYPAVSGGPSRGRRPSDGGHRGHGALEGVQSAVDVADGGEHTLGVGDGAHSSTPTRWRAGSTPTIRPSRPGPGREAAAGGLLTEH